MITPKPRGRATPPSEPTAAPAKEPPAERTPGPVGSRPAGSAAAPQRVPEQWDRVVHTLLRFFAEDARDLPWRRPEAGAWGVLVSEFMLQQTPVSRVLPVYTQWLERWPAPADLAAEPVGEAVRAWGRLGYPRRAMRLHAAACDIVADHDGRVPDTVSELLGLPGVGEYTARAVATFAFGARTPVVDTNVRRVLSRVVRGSDSIREAATTADRAELETLLPAKPAVAARLSAAIMEFGALVCTATNPSCEACPLTGQCAWLAAGRPTVAPKRPAQTWHGTDRQVRGKVLAALRESRDPVQRTTIDLLWSDQQQLARAVDSLLADGLAVAHPTGTLALPG